MKKTRIVLLTAILLTVVMLMTSCASVGKVLNKKYDVAADVYSSNVILSELTGYEPIEYNGEFILFRSTDGVTVSNKVFSMNSATVVATFADTAFTYDIDLYEGLPVFTVTKTEVDINGEGGILDTTYTLYDSTGASIVTTDYAPASPAAFGEVIVYNFAAYDVAENGALTKACDVPEYLALGGCDYFNDEYYYTLGNMITVYDHSFNAVATWSFPQYADQSNSFVLNNGDILVQYVYTADEDAKKYDISTTADGESVKLNLESYIISANNGKAKKLKLDYFVQNVVTNYELYDKDAEKTENRFTKKFENIAYIVPIVDKKIDLSEANVDIVLMNNKGKAKGSLKLLDGEATGLPRKIGDDLYQVNTLTGGAIVKGSGKLVKAYNNSLRRCGASFIGEVAIYDLELNVIYNLVENRAEVIGYVGDTVYVRAENDTGYTVLSFRDGASTTLYTYNESDTSPALSFSIVEGVGYKTVDSASGDHKYYNAKGELLATTTYDLVKVSASSEYGIIVMRAASSEDITYHVFSVAE